MAARKRSPRKLKPSSPHVIPYALNLASSGKLKLRAKALLATGAPDDLFEAFELLHEAARIQEHATRALPNCPPATKLASLAEVCWCYVEGRDPPRAADAWGEVLSVRQGMDPRMAEAILSRLAPRFEASRREFASTVNSSPALLAMRDAGRLSSWSASERERARKELASVLAKFPGATGFWWMQYRLAEASENKEDAWEALSRARRLAPENQRFLAMSLIVATWALPRPEAERHIASIRGSFDRSGAEVCLMYAFSEIALARKASPEERRQRWQRGLDAAQSGLAQAESDGLRKNLKAAQLLLQELLAGRKPTLNILYLAGLSELAVATGPSVDVMKVLEASIREAA